MSLDRVGVVMVTYSSEATAPAALAALPAELLGPIVVVDNASPDGTVATLGQGAAPLWIVVNDRNLGFGAAVNRGLVHLAHCEYVLVLNPDARIEDADLRMLVAHMDRSPQCGLVAPRLFRGAEALTSCGRQATVWTELRTVAPAPLARRLPDRRYRPSHDMAGAVGYVEGACMLFRRRALESVGGFDEGYFLFYEELDIARRFRARNYTVELCPSARADHTGGASRATVAFDARPALARSAVRYLRTWHGPAAASAYRLSARSLWRWRRRHNRMAPAEAAALLEGVGAS